MNVTNEHHPFNLYAAAKAPAPAQPRSDERRKIMLPGSLANEEEGGGRCGNAGTPLAARSRENEGEEKHRTFVEVHQVEPIALVIVDADANLPGRHERIPRAPQKPTPSRSVRKRPVCVFFTANVAPRSSVWNSCFAVLLHVSIQPAGLHFSSPTRSYLPFGAMNREPATFTYVQLELAHLVGVLGAAKVGVLHHLPDAVGEHCGPAAHAPRVHVHPPVQHLARADLLIDAGQMLDEVANVRQPIDVIRALQQVVRDLLEKRGQIGAVIVRQRVRNRRRHIAHDVLERVLQVDDALQRLLQVEEVGSGGKQLIHHAIHQQHATGLRYTRHE
uniref:Uncharacterized protein n=1 Tax=Anopheles atroparvus TaxID=41427 RepID=A0A182IX15_ANOAO